MFIRITCCVVCLFISASALAQNPVAIPPENGVPVQDAVNLLYNPSDGSLSIETTGNIGGMTTTTLTSAGGNFAPDVAIASGIEFAPFPDQNTESKFFKLTAQPATQDVWTFNPGYLTNVGNTFASVSADLTWSGSLDPSGSWSDAPGLGPYLHIVPEPSAMGLLIGALLCLATRRK